MRKANRKNSAMNVTIAHPETERSQTRDRNEAGRFDALADFWRSFFAAAFDPYCPERHYMRGPGPACRAKQKMLGNS